MKISRQFLFFLVLVLGACYVPAPVDITTVAPGDDVRVLVSPNRGNGNPGAMPATVTEHRGEFMRLSTDSLMIGTLLSVATYGGVTLEPIRQPVTFSRADIVQVTVPRLHRSRTLAVVGGAVALAVIFVADLFDIRGDGGSGPSEPRPPDTSPFTGRW